MIINPILPPKKGYVEVVNPDGEHVYAPIDKEEDILDLDAMSVDHEYRITLLELGVE